MKITRTPNVGAPLYLLSGSLRLCLELQKVLHQPLDDRPVEVPRGDGTLTAAGLTRADFTTFAPTPA